MKYAMIIALMIAAAGCISQTQTGKDLAVKMTAEPPQVFQGQATTLFIDIDNRGGNNAYYVVFELFDTGIMKLTRGIDERGCRKAFPALKPGEFQTFECKLQAGEVKETTSGRISAKTTFSAMLDAVQLIEMISREEYERRKAAGTFATQPRKYTYSDGRLALDIELSEEPPVIERSGKNYFIYLTIRNTGSGFVGDIEPGNFVIVQGTDIRKPAEIQSNRIELGLQGSVSDFTIGDNLVKCERLDQKLSPIGDRFPRITCELLPPDNIDVIGNYPMAIKILYNYETRQSLDIRIVK